MASVRRVLSIAGSDSGGGAGIQADLKTFAALGVFGMTAITAVTAQNTLGVTAIQAVAPEMVAAQIDAVLSDIGADAVKTGMLANRAVVEAVGARLAEYRGAPLVVDPVMMATSGKRLLDEDGIRALKKILLPLALVVTTNIPEAEALTGRKLDTAEARRQAARDLAAMGPRHVVVKGGHMEGAEAIDLLYDGHRFEEFRAPRIASSHTHGTGCTFAAAIAAYLSQGKDMSSAVGLAKEYVTGAIIQGFALGHGHGPLNHTWQGRRVDSN